MDLPTQLSECDEQGISAAVFLSCASVPSWLANSGLSLFHGTIEELWMEAEYIGARFNKVTTRLTFFSVFTKRD